MQTYKPMAKGDSLGEFELLLLLAILRLGSNAYGLTIRQEIIDHTDRKVSRGATYAGLARLEEKGFAKSREADASPERGDRAKRYFKITAAGKRAVDASMANIGRLADGLKPALGVAGAK